MPFVNINQVGGIGVVRDLSTHELPNNAWTDAKNVRFLDGNAVQFYGHGQVYGTPSNIPQHVLAAQISGARYWIYLTAANAYAVTNSGGPTVTTDITHATPRTGVVNQWTSTMLSGIPVVNVGDTSKVPMYWDLNLANNFVDLPAWQSNCFCKSLRAYKQFLVALNVSRQPLKTISSITRVGTTATLTTSSAHGLSNGDSVYITQATPTQYNGTFTITVTGATTFTYTMSSDPGASATGGILYAGTVTNYPRMIRWSHPADPGSVPSSWDVNDATKDAGEFDLGEGSDPIIDGQQLRDSFMIYTETSVWRMDFTGGQNIFKFSKVLGISGALNRNCIVEVDGYHVVLTNQDVVVHDGQTATSVMDKQTRRDLFQNIDATSSDKCFVFKNPFFNEVFICYPSVGQTVCDKAMVWNYKDKTVSFRDVPNLNHANFGAVDNSLNSTFDSDSLPFDSDLSLFNSSDFVPSTARVMLASNDNKLFMLDSSASWDGALPDAYLERRGLSFGAPDKIKFIRSVRPRIVGSTGYTVKVKVGWANDPYSDPTYSDPIEYVIGQTVSCDCRVSGRYMSIMFITGTGYQWRLDSYDLDIEISGAW